ncbi:MAG: FKBP-type peptidyl-prolyl cis-trans isomerase [Daejeonella sp.]
MKNLLKYNLVAVFALLAFSACKKEYESIEQIDERKIQEYVKANNLNLTKAESGIYYNILSEGTGEIPKNSEKVFFTYTAKSIDGTVYYDNSSFAGYSDFLGYVKPDGWRYALSLLKRGGKVKVVFPSSLGFGRNGQSPYKGNDVIDSELELLNVDNQTEMDELLITRFIQKNNLSMQRDSSGVYYQIITPGTGDSIPKPSSVIKVAYTGKFLNGKTFDSATSAKPLESPLSVLVPGWVKTIPLIRKGGKIRILIPSALGYGSYGNPTIPPNTILDFTIDLISFTNP